jgi:hypothetical protein
MRMRNAFGLIAAAGMMSATVTSYGCRDDSFIIETSKREKAKSTLTKAQRIKRQKKNRQQKQSRKNNRKK